MEEQQEVNTLEVFPNGGGTAVWVKERADTGKREAGAVDLLQAVYASGYVPRSRKAVHVPEGVGNHETFKMHVFRITKL